METNIVKKNNWEAKTAFLVTLLILAGFWFVLSKVETNGLWEILIASVVFFVIFPLVSIRHINIKSFFKQFFYQKISKKVFLKVFFQLAVFFALGALIVQFFGWGEYLKLNYLAREEYYLQKGGMIYLVNFLLLPVILFSQEFFFRGWLMAIFERSLNSIKALLLQAVLFVVFQVLMFESFQWQFILIFFVFSLFLGWITLQTRNIFVPFAARWMVVLTVDGILLYNINKITNQISLL